MKIECKAFFGGVALIAAVPLLLLWQSSNPAKGTSPGKTKYNIYHAASLVSLHLYNGNPKALHLFCFYTLGHFGNGSYTAAWIDHIASRCGECSDVHLARAWLCGFLRNSAAMQKEFEAARAAAKDPAEAERVNDMIERVMK